MKSSVIFRDGCSLNTEFIKAILAALLLASAFVGQFCKYVALLEISKTWKSSDVNGKKLFNTGSPIVRVSYLK